MVCAITSARQPHVHIPADRMELVFKSVPLADSATLSSSGVKDNNLIHVVKRVVRSALTPVSTLFRVHGSLSQSVIVKTVLAVPRGTTLDHCIIHYKLGRTVA